MKRLGKRNEHLYVFMHLQGTETRRLFKEIEEELTGGGGYFHIRMVNVYELFVDDLFSTYRLFTEGVTEAHILLICFGSKCQQIALKARAQIESMENHTLQMTAIDKNMNNIK